MRLVTLVLSLALMVLTGCASISRDSGFEVQTVELSGRQDGWQNGSVNTEVFSEDGSVAWSYVKLPQPVPSYWQQEFVDQSRSYEVVEGNRKVRQPLVREVFRVVVFRGEAIHLYQAKLDRDRKGFNVLIPVRDRSMLVKTSLLILSSDGKWVMTTLGKRVEFEQGFDPSKLPPDFFVLHRSPTMQVVELNPVENEHARLALQGMLHGYTYPFGLRDRGGSYLGRSKADIDSLVTFTSLTGVLDRLTSCTDPRISPGMKALAKAAPWLFVLINGYDVANALLKEDCLK